MSTISASTTSTTAYKVTADTTGALVLQTGATPTTAVTISSAQVVTLTNALAEASGGTGTTVGYNGFKNRLINGAMVIDQRNAGASVTIGSANGLYTLDRYTWYTSQASKLSTQQSSTAPTGFTKSMLVTSLSAYTPVSGDYFFVRQGIEGFNIADLAWGTANAAAVTLSFWVRSSLTGTFGGQLLSSNGAYCYVYSYTINAANTWEQKTITIVGPTTGTFNTDNTGGTFVSFTLASARTVASTGWQTVGTGADTVTGSVNLTATNGATFYITGVQLEKGSTATSFDYRPYGTELALCQRYYCKTFDIGTAPGNNITTSGAFMLGNISSGNYEPSTTWRFPVDMRTAPTLTLYNPETGTTAQWSAGGGTVSAGARALFVATSSAVIDNTDVTLTGLNSWRIQAASSAEL